MTWLSSSAACIASCGVLARHSVSVGLRSFSFTLALLFLVGLSLWADRANAASTRLRTGTGANVVVTAESMTRDAERQVIELSGNVQVTYGMQYISCDRALINLRTQELEAAGNLVIASPQAYVEGDRALLSYATNTGIIENGFVKSGQVIFEGRVVHKTGENTYEAENAAFTACTTCPTAWTFTGTRIEAEIGGYAYIKRSVLRVGDIPVFWLPYLVVPLKSERQTGLLIPSFDFSRVGGAAVALNYFWAISRSQDATISPKYYTERGLKGLLNYRYLLSETSGGELNTAFSRDRVFERSPLFQSKPEGGPAYRWFVDYDHRYELPGNFIQSTQLNFVSDLAYPGDFPEEIGGYGEPALENRLSLTRNTDTTHSSLDVAYYINMLKEDPLASNRDAVHRWPELRYSLAETRVAKTGLLSDLLFNFNVDYVNFAREDFAFDDISIDPVSGKKVVDITRTEAGRGGVFNPDSQAGSGDVIRAGQRLTLQPEVSYPLRFGAIDILPSAQFRHTQYSFNLTPAPGSSFETTPFRHYLRGRVAARMRLSRIYGDNTEMPEEPLSPTSSWVDKESASANETVTTIPTPPSPIVRPNLYRHEIEPEIVYAGVPYQQQTANVGFFGEQIEVPSFVDAQPVSDSDFQLGQGVQFDYEDRFTSRQTVSFVLGNRIIRKSWLNGAPNYKQIVNFKLGQSYDLTPVERIPQQRFAWSDISALLDVRLDNFETNTLLRYYPYHNVTNTSLRAKVMDDRGRFFQLILTQNFGITDKTDEAYSRRQENVGLAAGFDSKYLTFMGGIDYLPRHWWPIDFSVKQLQSELNIKPPGDCWGIRLKIGHVIGREASFKLDFDYKFGG